MITEPEIGLSVCMAASNGQDYVTGQIGSILQQVSPKDELVVVDDTSTDGTADVVRGINDPCIVLMPSRDNQGYVTRFEKPITASRNEYIMLSDKDDIWLQGRVDRLIKSLQDKCFAASNFTVFVGTANKLQEVPLRERDSRRWIAAIFAMWIGCRPYYGWSPTFTGT
ncbi:glycosyltransferase involved in cell wall biosynthesis [Arthrobacter pascens]|uniref:glycosyltransferase n=1 Tax=Arthrobacter pascens TaxID=1677 RepID=UPI0027924F36|nr:glycosyltransferase [Arthrobacter pascens]MDQ0677788.1 glycosyltransferase involved in cell wall biosynthesis [Arthrobacter pascens]